MFDNSKSANLILYFCSVQLLFISLAYLIKTCHKRSEQANVAAAQTEKEAKEVHYPFFNPPSDKPQTLLLENLSHFLTLKKNEEQKRIQQSSNAAYIKAATAHLASIQNLKNDLTAHGHCHGFSICYGYMQHIGKRKWWQAALVQLANWNRDPTTLNRIVYLPDAINREGITLSFLFERILNYVYTFQAHGDDYFQKEMKMDFNQTTLLERNNKFFEGLDQNQKIRKIRRSQHVSGNFSPFGLIDFFQEKYFSDGIFIVTNINHATNIFFADNRWHFYDPNHDHSTLDTLEKTFSNKYLFIRTLTHQIGTGFSISALHTQLGARKEIIPNKLFNTLIRTEKNNLIRGKGLFLIADHQPEKILHILEEANKTLQGKIIFLDSLLLSNNNNFPTLYYIAESRPKLIPKIIKVISDIPGAKETILKCITALCEDNIGVLTCIAKDNVEVAEILLAFVKDAEFFYERMSDMLKEKIESPSYLGVPKNSTKTNGDIFKERFPSCLPLMRGVLVGSAEEKSHIVQTAPRARMTGM